MLDPRVPFFCFFLLPLLGAATWGVGGATVAGAAPAPPVLMDDKPEPVVRIEGDGDAALAVVDVLPSSVEADEAARLRLLSLSDIDPILRGGGPGGFGRVPDWESDWMDDLLAGVLVR